MSKKSLQEVCNIEELTKFAIEDSQYAQLTNSIISNIDKAVIEMCETEDWGARRTQAMHISGMLSDLRSRIK